MLVLAVLALAVGAVPANAVQPGRNGVLATPFADNEEADSSTGARPNPIRYGYLTLAGGAGPARPNAWCEFRRTDPPPCRRFRTVEFSPDGTLLADARDGIQVRGLDGAIVRQVSTMGAGSPTWSPDGSRLAFLNSGDVFTVRTDGTRLRRITRTQGGSSAGTARSVSWSSRGRLAVSFLREEPTIATIATMTPDGRGARVVERLRNSSWSVDWTPDGRRLLVSGNGIRLVDARGRGRTRLLRRDGEGARISPDGRLIAFLSQKTPLFQNAVVVARANGRAPRTVSLIDSETGYPNEGDLEYLRETGPLSWQPLR